MMTHGPRSKTTVVYIAGYGRSGSTVLDLLLGNHPKVFGAGETSRLFLHRARGGSCSCGASYNQCPIWQRVFERAELPSDPGSLLSLWEATATVEAGGSTHDWPQYPATWRRIMQSISEVSGKDIIVDSSKSTRIARHRRALLNEACGFETKVIHLVRDPRAVMWSAARGSNARLEAGLPRRRLETLRALVNWTRTNAWVDREGRAIGPNLLRLRYEDLVTRPGPELRRLGAFIGLDPEPLLTQLERGSDFDPGHGVGGNRLRRKGPVELREDSEWKHRLPRLHRLMALSAWPVARHYGYSPGSSSI